MFNGMYCSNCAQRIENAFNSIEGLWAKVNFENKSVTVRAKKIFEGAQLSKIVNDAGYVVIDFSLKK